MNVIPLGQLSSMDQQTEKHISLAWQVLTPPLPSPITILAGAASHRVWKEQHHSLGRDRSISTKPVLGDWEGPGHSLCHR